MTDEQLDRMLAGMKNEEPPAAAAEGARDAVWRQLSAASVCSRFRGELEAYASGALPEARRLLVEDHLGRCADCRRAMNAPTTKPVVREMKPRGTSLGRWLPWAAAASLAAVSLYASRDTIDRALAPGGSRATLEDATGGVYLLARGAMNEGDRLEAGDVIRTAAGAHAVLRLVDGSRVELNQRTELHIESAWTGETIRLDRGDVIVEAAKQRLGRLRVATRDSLASVKGTIFGVSADAAGSVVSVVEGSVAVEQPNIERVLGAGATSASNRALAKEDVHSAVAWSENSEKYFSILAALTGLERDIAALPGPTLRTEPRLLHHMPAGTNFYIALPNLNGTIGQAMALFEQRARENAALGEWWASEHGAEVKRAVEALQSVTSYLGDEIVVMDGNDGASKFMVVMAAVRPGQQAALRTALDRVPTDAGTLPYRITPDLLLVSESAANLDAIAPRLGTGAASEFASRIRTRYSKGAGWLAAINVANLPVQGHTPARVLGLSNATVAFLEQRAAGAADELEATIAFTGARSGVASWLAAPGAAGSTEYVSAEAQAAISASTRDPRQAFEEMLRLMGAEATDALAKFELDTGVNVRADLAGALGTDFTIALERVTLPMPAWVAAAEVLQPAALDSVIGRMVEAYNREKPGMLTLTTDTANGRTWHSITGSTPGMTLHWTYDRGYLIASPDRAVALNAIATRDSGLSLTRSTAFRQAVPQGNLHHSAYLWLNVNGAVADAAALFNSPALQSLVGTRTPTLVVLDGEAEQIHAQSRTRLTSLVLDLVLTTTPAMGAEGAR